MDLSVGAAQHLVALLDTLRAVPSTPRTVAECTAVLVSRVGERLPDPYHPQPWHRDRERQDYVRLDEATITAVVELLELFAAMPSTPPALVEDAARQAEVLWHEVEAS